MKSSAVFAALVSSAAAFSTQVCDRRCVKGKKIGIGVCSWRDGILVEK